MKILVTGAAGNIGKEIVAQLQPNHEVVGADLAEFDIADWNSTHAFIQEQHPDLVIHPAAWTDVDGCARDPQKAIMINGLGAQNVAVAAAAVSAPIVHISTNEVFDGYGEHLYKEYDRTQPTNPYGYSKWVAEQAIPAVNSRHYIVRPSWVFSHGGRNFIQAILGAAEAGKQLRVVTNEVANPTYSVDLAEAIIKLSSTGRYGIYHLANEGAVSRYQFARYVLDVAGYKDVPIQPISASEWPRASTPPMYAGLENMAAAMLGIRLRPWQQAVDAFMTREGILS
ncbi:MAG: dTDP-4-dehydrorhamnose reductase [Anaerolineae bacterium]|nr:dTDP-4-dehydrorhamnose reductase [Anaerolineae bacterium]